MKKVAGMKVKLYIMDGISGKVLAGQKNATLNRSAETIDSTSKDSDGNWKESVPGYKEFSIDADGAFVANDEAYEILETSYVNGEAVKAYLEFPSGSKYVGSCIITDLPLEIPFDDLVSYSVSLQGSGALVKTDSILFP